MEIFIQVTYSKKSNPDIISPRGEMMTGSRVRTASVAIPSTFRGCSLSGFWADLDHRAIEDNVRATCGDLVTECVVVGNGRPSPSLFIETNSEMPHPKLKREVLRRTRQFHSRRYLHERITSADMIVIVEKGSLPRTATKGNVRRRATEDAFRTLLNKIYGTEWAGSS